MRTKLLLSFFTIVLMNSAVNAQYLRSETASEKGKKKKGQDNILKIAPLGFVTGAFPIYYERRINKFFSLQVGGGLTGKNYLRDIIQKAAKVTDIAYPWGKNSDFTDAAEELFSFEYRKPGMGYMFSVQPRLYFESEAPDGAYVAFSYDYYHYNFSIPGLVVENNKAIHNGSPKSEYENLNDIMVHFGYQAIFDHLTFEPSGGFGLRSAKGSKYVALYDESANQVTNEAFANYSQRIFSFSIGLKVGYHF
jgi:hypothetical protein